MTSHSDVADLLLPGAIVPVDPQTTQRLVMALRSALASRSDKQTGVPAFPTNTGLGNHQAEGMTLRDYFAAHAMQGMMVMPLPDAVDDAPKFLAKTAYGIADAMLEARDATP